MPYEPVRNLDPSRRTARTAIATARDIELHARRYALRILVPAAMVLAATMTLGAEWKDPIREALPPPAPPMDDSYEGVLFWDSFSRGIGAWEADRDNVWSVRNGMLRADLPDKKNFQSFLYAGKDSWSDYSLEFHVLAMRGTQKGAALRVDGRRGMGIKLRGGGHHDVVLERLASPIGEADVINANGMWHHVRIEARGKHYVVWVDGQQVLEKNDIRTGLTNGRIALMAHTGDNAECTVWFDNVIVRKLASNEASDMVAEAEKSDD